MVSSSSTSSMRFIGLKVLILSSRAGIKTEHWHPGNSHNYGAGVSQTAWVRHLSGMDGYSSENRYATAVEFCQKIGCAAHLVNSPAMDSALPASVRPRDCRGHETWWHPCPARFRSRWSRRQSFGLTEDQRQLRHDERTSSAVAARVSGCGHGADGCWSWRVGFVTAATSQSSFGNCSA